MKMKKFTLIELLVRTTCQICILCKIHISPYYSKFKFFAMEIL